MLLIDAHVHIYDCFDLETLFESAYVNFQSLAQKMGYGGDFTGILLLTETSKDNWFRHLSEFADGKNLPHDKRVGKWKFYLTNENCSLFARSENEKNLILIEGRQIVTEERIEILALCTSAGFTDGKPILDLIKEIREKNGVPVIPWGVGKWFGKRGRIIRKIINNNSSLLYLGDNRNRPNLWPRPTLFELSEKRGIAVLPGSDPLPFRSESCRIGSYGFSMKSSIDPNEPGRAIKRILRNTSDTSGTQFGSLEKNYRFLLNQIRMQIAKRTLKPVQS
jgi:hypothetical protein